MEYDVLEFADPVAFRNWLATYGQQKNGVWLRIYKKATGVETVTYAQALDEALCYGWIDGQRKSYDEQSFIQKFTPRRPRSLWSKRNIEHTERLINAGLMTEAGMREIDRAKEDGRWEAAYDGASTMQVPDYFLAALRKNPKAEAFYNELNKSNKYAIAWQLQTAKTDATRLRRTEKFIAALELRQKPHG